MENIMAINTSQSTITDYNAYTVTTISTLLNRMQFVWKDQEDLVTDQIIKYKDSEWKQGDMGVVVTDSYELTEASFNIDLDDSNVFVCSLTQNVTINDILNFSAGESFKVIFTQDTTGNRTVNWPSDVSLVGSLQSSANAVTICSVLNTGTILASYGGI